LRTEQRGTELSVMLIMAAFPSRMTRPVVRGLLGGVGEREAARRAGQ
jgi:hypothetical protein